MRQYLLVCSVVVLLLTAGCVAEIADNAPVSNDSGEHAFEGVNETSTIPNGLELYHLDVGQADATVLISPSGETMVIDTGDWRQDGEEVIAFLEDQGITHVDHLVSTHAHADHIGGHAALIDQYETEYDGIGAIYDSGVAHTSQTYENYLDAVEEHDVTLFEVVSGDEIPFDEENLTVTVLNPPAGESGTDLHENSVALAIEYGDFQYLTTGDAEAAAESRMVSEWGSELESSVYQAGHHGSSTSSTENFLETVNPAIAVISSGFDSQYGHPHDEVFERFAEHDIETHWTGVHGTVVIETNGTSMAIDTSTSGPTDPVELAAMKPDDTQRIALDTTPAVSHQLTG